jgi:transposase
MIGIAMYTTILTLHKQGTSQREISRLTKTHRRTVKKIIKKYEEKGIEAPSRYERSSEVGNWDEEVVKLLSRNLSVVRIFEELRKQGFELSYNSLSRYIRMRNIKKNTCIRFHSNPGEEGQVDFGDIGRR